MMNHGHLDPTKAVGSDVQDQIQGQQDHEMPLASVLLRLGIKGWRRHLTICSGARFGQSPILFSSPKWSRFLLMDVSGTVVPSTAPNQNRMRSFRDKKLTHNKTGIWSIDAALRNGGWTVLRLWEHAIKKDSEVCAGHILYRLVVKLVYKCYLWSKIEP
jgi:hypothetical protein